MSDIYLTNGSVCIVDDADFEWLSQWTWNAAWYPRSQSFYAIRTDRSSGKKTIRMHRQILGVTDTRQQVDHRSRNTLDNRRENLRLATLNQQQQNRHKRKDNKSGYIGAFFDSASQRWRAQLKVNGKNLYLGVFGTSEEAARARDAAAVIHHGEFAVLNFSEASCSE